MNRLWRILVCAMLLMTFVYGGGQAFAEQKANDWPPLPGVYMRKTAGGVPNGRIDVFVKPFNGDCAVLAAVESRNYNGNDYAESDMAPRIYAAGRMDVGLNSAEVILTHGYTDKRNPAPDPKNLPLIHKKIGNTISFRLECISILMRSDRLTQNCNQAFLVTENTPVRDIQPPISRFHP